MLSDPGWIAWSCRLEIAPAGPTLFRFSALAFVSRTAMNPSGSCGDLGDSRHVEVGTVQTETHHFPPVQIQPHTYGATCWDPGRFLKLGHVAIEGCRVWSCVI